MPSHTASEPDRGGHPEGKNVSTLPHPEGAEQLHRKLILTPNTLGPSLPFVNTISKSRRGAGAGIADCSRARGLSDPRPPRRVSSFVSDVATARPPWEAPAAPRHHPLGHPCLLTAPPLRRRSPPPAGPRSTAPESRFPCTGPRLRARPGRTSVLHHSNYFNNVEQLRVTGKMQRFATWPGPRAAGSAAEFTKCFSATTFTFSHVGVHNPGSGHG